MENANSTNFKKEAFRINATAFDFGPHIYGVYCISGKLWGNVIRNFAFNSSQYPRNLFLVPNPKCVMLCFFTSFFICFSGTKLISLETESLLWRMGNWDVVAVLCFLRAGNFSLTQYIQYFSLVLFSTIVLQSNEILTRAGPAVYFHTCFSN